MVRGSEAEEAAGLIDGEGGEVGEAGHEEELADGPFPRAGFAGDDGGRRQALEGVDVEDDQGDEGKGRKERCAIGAFGGGHAVADEAAGFDIVVGFLNAEEDGHGGVEDLAGGEGGEDGGAGASIEAEGLDDGFDDRTDAADGTVGEGFGGIVSVVFGIGAEGPEEDAEAEDEGAGVFDEGPGSVGDVAEDVGPLGRAIGRHFQHEVGAGIGSETFAEHLGDEEGGEGAEGVDGEEDEGLFP